MPLLLQRMFSKDSERRKKGIKFITQQILYHLKGHRGEAVLRDFKQPPLLEWQWHSNIILRFATSTATSWRSAVTVYYRRTAALPAFAAVA